MNKRLIYASLGILCIAILVCSYLVFARNGILADVNYDPTRNVLANQVSTLDTVGSNYKLESDKQLSEINLSGLKGQKISFSFALNASSSVINFLGGSKGKVNFTIQKQHLASKSGNRIQLANIDDRLVHLWAQKQYSFEDKTKISSQIVPELLVKSERTDFFDPNIGTAENELLNSAGTFAATPPNNIDGMLEANKIKQILVTLQIPANAAADTYASRLTLIANPGGSNEKIFKTIKISLKVVNQKMVDFNDVDATKIAGCYTNDKIALPGITTDWKYISTDLFKNRMLELKKLGCSALTLRADENVDLKSELEIMSSLGFKGPAIINYNSGKRITGDMQKNLANLLKREIFNDKAIKTDLMWYGIDEPNAKVPLNGETISPYEQNKNKIEDLKNVLRLAGVPQDQILSKITTSATPDTFNSLAAEGYMGNFPINSYGYNCAIENIPGVQCIVDFLELNRQTNSSLYANNPNLYYFQSYNEDPVAIRYLSGFGFSSSRFRGFFANPMYGYYNATSRPIYKEDLTNNLLSRWHKQMMTFYPAKDGFIPTIESEGLREGISDSKLYLTYILLAKTLPECTVAATSDTTVNTRPEVLVSKFKFDNSFYKLPASLTFTDIDQTRQSLMEAISKMTDNNCFQPGKG